MSSPIPIGTSIVLIAVGAILAYAVDGNLIDFINLNNAGIILVIVGILGLVISILFMFLATRGGPDRAVEEFPRRPERR